MPTIDPFVPLTDWRASLVRGGPAAVDRFLDAIDATLPPGWIRDSEYERTRLRPDRIRCYLFDRAGDAAVRVWLQRVTATRVRGGPVPSQITEDYGAAPVHVATVGDLPSGTRTWTRDASGVTWVRVADASGGVRFHLSP